MLFADFIRAVRMLGQSVNSLKSATSPSFWLPLSGYLLPAKRVTIHLLDDIGEMG